jgi:transcriptional regulator with XRE-family HTH domain
VVHDLSATGLLLETSIELAVDERLEVELPEATNARARVIWKSGNLFGCQFTSPLPRAALSAAQLLSSPEIDIVSRSPSKLDAIGAVGTLIRRWRQQQGLTVAKFAEKMGVSRPTVWAWESGKSQPRKGMLSALRREMGLANSSEASAPVESAALEPRRGDESLQRAVAETKERIAIIAGTMPEKVMIIVEL